MASRAEDDLSNRREGGRIRSVLALGKITHANREHVCLVRDVSAGGLKIEMTAPPEAGMYVIVEMLGLPPVPARVAWQRDEYAGLAFNTPQDLDRMCRRGLDAAGVSARGPRFAIGRPARLRAGGVWQAIEVVNVSVGGARLSGAERLAIDGPGWLEIGDMPSTLAGYVRWVDGDDAGFSFTPPLDFRTLLDVVLG